ncbi:MAG: hypothetical protein J5761_05430 [Paludibacteraceae bacterium]|nr:hypothetical protein [Paludibacteraceae bacterium]
MMRKLFFVCFVLASTAVFAIPKLVYNGDTLEWNYSWQKKQCGTLDINANIIEVSGIACSRVTPGYIWMQSDETDEDTNPFIIATDEKGAERACKVKFNKIYRWDWEDMSGGVYDGKNYLFFGAFGDNDETDGEYSIIYFEEPTIDPINQPEVTVTAHRIKYQYPGGLKHNAEALMYDNVEQMIYVITKVYYNVCQVFKIPFRLDYGDVEQTLEYVCDLGVKSDLGAGTNPYKGFHLVTAADISPDGKYILIKNHNNIVSSYCWVLYWVRQEGESVADAVQRQPQPIKAYNTTEWQGEAICWLDDDTFYTTSDSDDGNPPIFKFTRKWGEGIENTQTELEDGERTKVMIGNTLYIRTQAGLYTMDGRLAK